MKKKTNKPSRLTLKGWAALDSIKREMDEAIEKGSNSMVPEFIFQTIELSCGGVNRDSFWMDVAELYNEVLKVNQPTKAFPVLTTKEKAKKLPWEYKGRSWYFWLNLFASHYGWDEEKVGGLDIDDAIGLYQEILVDEQLDQEFYYSLSEIAYPYNSTTKQSNFQPLGRPDWMVAIAGKTPVKKTKIPKSMMPQGLIIGEDTV